MPTTVAPVMNLRRPAILPFFNWRTILVLVVLSFIALNITLNLLTHEAALDYLYLLMMIQLAPIAIAISRGHFTYIGIVLFFHFSTVSLAKFDLLRNHPSYVSSFPEVLLAIKEETFCTLLTILVYYGFRIFIFQGTTEKVRFQDLVMTRPQILLLTGYISIVPLFIQYLPSWFLIIHFLLLSADMLLLFTAVSPGNEKLVFGLKAFAVVMAVRYFLQTGMLTMMGSVLLLFFFIGAIKRQKKMVGFAMAFLILVAAIQSVKSDYRVYCRDNPQISMSERLQYVELLLADKYLNGGGSKSWNSRWDSILGGFARAGDDSLERVLALTPKYVPFWGGETYASIPFLFIPRVLWPDKPSRHFWNKYGRVYRVLSDNDYQTSVGVSYLAEGYMNFGYAGMYTVAVFVGFLIAMMERFSYLVLGGNFHFPFVLYVLPLLSSGSDLGSILNSLFLLIAITPFMRPWLKRLALRDEYT